ncbi:hypothetical protein [Risungbinella massiliensis]|uniref:hypothetical protein n=1 Tax=Risungbinella massiliensis TaxID=1329796 RepID=UPI0005CC6875|nr:hypothetical protein [Risungbinella massiliensis]
MQLFHAGLIFFWESKVDDQKDKKTEQEVYCEMGTRGCNGLTRRNWRGVMYCDECDKEDFSQST